MKTSLPTLPPIPIGGFALSTIASVLLTAFAAMPAAPAEPDPLVKLLQEPILEPGIAAQRVKAGP